MAPRTAFKPNNMAPMPQLGTRAVDITVDFTQPGVLTSGNNFVVNGDLTQEREGGLIDIMQTLFVDNSGNPATLSFTINTIGKSGQTIKAEPFSQGYYAISVEDHLMYQVVSDFYGVVPMFLYNVPFPYSSWNVGPPLTRSSLNFQNLAVGDNILMAAVANQRNRVYRMLFDVSGNTNMQFFDGPSINALPLTGLMTFVTNGSLDYDYDGIARLRTSRGNALILNSSAAVGLGGDMLGVAL